MFFPPISIQCRNENMKFADFARCGVERAAKRFGSYVCMRTKKEITIANGNVHKCQPAGGGAPQRRGASEEEGQKPRTGWRKAKTD